MFDAILFDFDGVLADTEPLHFACWREVLAGFDIDLDPARLHEFVGVADWVMLERLGKARVPAISAEELWPGYERKRALFQARIEAERIIPEDTVELLHRLHRNYKLAVVSSSHRSEIEPPLKRARNPPVV